jgi:Zn ribbon nucleic-acid-binding protein
MDIIEQSGFDSEEFHLGRICKRGHDFAGTGQSLRHKTNHCAQCRIERNATVNKALRSATLTRQKASSASRKEDRDSLLALLKSLGIENPERYKLGKLCAGSHEFQGTGQSLRLIRGGECPQCVQSRRKLVWENNKSVLSAQKREYHQRPESQARSRERYQESRKKEGWVEAKKEYLRAYYAQNKDRLLAQNKDRRTLSISTIEGLQKKRAADRAWRESRRDVELERLRAFRRDNPEKSRSYGHRRRAKKRMAHSLAYTDAELNERLKNLGGACVYCGNPHEQWDHFLPIARGGADVIGNLVPSCKFCNCSKSDRDPKAWYREHRSYSRKNWNRILRILGKQDESYSQIPLL